MKNSWNVDFRTTLRQLIITESCPILIKFCVVIVRSLVYMYTNFRQNRTIFRPYFGCETHINGRDNPKFWYFSSLTKLWKWPKFEKNPKLRSWGWFYTVSWNAGCGHMCKINPMIDIVNIFQTQVIFIFWQAKKNVKIWGCHNLWCAFHSQNKAKKWSDFNKIWYLESVHFKPKTHQILLKSDNYRLKIFPLLKKRPIKNFNYIKFQLSHDYFKSW